MQYGRYQEKMKRLAAFLGKLYRRRIPILAALVGILTAVAVVILTKGVIVAESDCPAERVYGDKSEYRVFVLWGLTEYEYRPEGGEEWTVGRPLMPGSYQVRAAGKTAFGKKNYTEIHTVTVLPREISPTVSDSRIKYGETPEVTADLAKGDELICEIQYESVTTHTRVWVHRYTVTIRGKDGSDRTAAYVIADTPKTELEIIPRELEVTVQDASKVYDDLVLTFDGYEISRGTLLEGDSLVAVFGDSLTEAGTKENRPRIRVVQGVRDVTGWYDITVRSGKLTVEKRPLVIRTGSASYVYAGIEISHTEYTLDPSTPLADGHYMLVSDAASLLDCGQIKNTLTFRIRSHGRGRDVTENYSLFLEEGTLTVTPREVTVHSESAELVYSGTKQGYPYVTVENGVGDEYRAEAYNTICDVGSTENILKIRFYRGGKDITSNYIIKGYTYGTVTVTPRHMTVELDYATKEYDGTPLSSNAFTVLKLKAPGTPEGLVAGHSLSLETQGSVVFGSADNVYVEGSAVVRDSAGDDVTKNYSITVINGILNVTPRELTIKTDSATKFYDGTPLTCDSSSYDPTRLLPGHTLHYAVDGSRTDAGYSPNTVKSGSIMVLDGDGGDVSRYYDVTVDVGTLRVRARPLTIRTDSHEWTYDGRAHSCSHSYEHVKGTLAEGHSLALSSTQAATLINAGKVKNTAYVKVWCGDEDMTANYEITYDFGTLTIHPRDITLVADDLQVIYDGSPHAFPEYRVDTSLTHSLVAGHSLVRQGQISTQTDAGTYENLHVCEIQDASGALVTKNYRITYVGGDLIILRRPLHFSVSGEKIYDGLPITDWPVTLLKDSALAPGHVLDVLPTGAGLSYVNVERFPTVVDTDHMKVWDENGNNVTKNYSLHWYDSYVEILPRPIYLKTADACKVYDGLPLTAGVVEVTAEGYSLASGHTLEMQVTGVGIEVGIHPNTCDPASPVIRDAEGGNVTRNYKIMGITQGMLTVQYPVRLTVTTGSAVKTADGLPLTCGDYTVEITEGVLPEGFTVDVTVLGRLTGVGRAENRAVVTVTDGEGNDVTALVPVTLRPGVLVIRSPEGEPDEPEDPERPLLILIPAEGHKVYDGTYLYPSDTLVITPLLGQLLEAGYTYEARVAGAQREVGMGESHVVAFTLYDPLGNDVTDAYALEIRTGRLWVTGEAVEVFLYPLETVCGDAPAVWQEGDYEILLAPEGVTLELEIRLERTEPGFITLADLQDRPGGVVFYRVWLDGEDVTDAYALVFSVPEGMAEYPVLTVKARPSV